MDPDAVTQGLIDMGFDPGSFVDPGINPDNFTGQGGGGAIDLSDFANDEDITRNDVPLWNFTEDDGRPTFDPGLNTANFTGQGGGGAALLDALMGGYGEEGRNWGGPSASEATARPTQGSDQAPGFSWRDAISGGGIGALLNPAAMVVAGIIAGLFGKGKGDVANFFGDFANNKPPQLTETDLMNLLPGQSAVSKEGFDYSQQPSIASILADYNNSSLVSPIQPGQESYSGLPGDIGGGLPSTTPSSGTISDIIMGDSLKGVQEEKPARGFQQRQARTDLPAINWLKYGFGPEMLFFKELRST